jgi:hypothetical protein
VRSLSASGGNVLLTSPSLVGWRRWTTLLILQKNYKTLSVVRLPRLFLTCMEILPSGLSNSTALFRCLLSTPENFT